MEEVASELKVTELKQGSLGKAYEVLNTEASTLLMLTFQWKDLEEHFNSIRKTLNEKLEELVEREKNVEAREKQLEAKESQLSVDIAVKAENLNGVEKRIEERNQALDLSIKKKREELEDTVRRYHQAQKSLVEKEKDMEHLAKGIKERTRRLDSLERSIRERSDEVETKKKELDSIRGMLRKCKDDLDVKDRQYRSVRGVVEDHKNEIEQKEQILRVLRSSIHECEKEIKLNDEKLKSIQFSILGKLSEFESIEKRLEFVRMDEEVIKNNFFSLKKSVDECAFEFDMKGVQFESLVENLQLKEKSLESKIEELGLIQKGVKEILEEVELKEKNVASFQRLVEERFQEVEKRDLFEKRVNEFPTWRQIGFESIQKSTGLLGVTEENNLKLDKSENNLNTADFLSFATYQYSITNGQYLQMLLSDQLRRHEFRCTELYAVLQTSPDPPKLVLDAVKGFYPLHSSSDNKELDLKIVRRSCLLLLGQLMNTSPDISPQVREEAMKLAVDWKAKMTVTTEKEKSLEVLGFLQLLASFRLSSAFNADEVLSLFDVVDQNREAIELHRALCIADKEHVDMEEEAQNFGANDTAAIFIQHLIQRNKFIAAIRLTYAFELTEMFEPVKLLKEYMDYVKSYTRQLCVQKKSAEEKDAATDEEIAALMNVVECIKIYGLETQLSPDNITKRIALLEKIKNDRKHSTLFFQSQDEKQPQPQPQPQQQQQQTGGRRKRRKGSPVSQQQSLKQSKNQCTRATSSPKSSCSPVSKVVPQQMNYPPNLIGVGAALASRLQFGSADSNNAVEIHSGQSGLIKYFQPELPNKSGSNCTNSVIETHLTFQMKGKSNRSGLWYAPTRFLVRNAFQSFHLRPAVFKGQVPVLVQLDQIQIHHQWIVPKGQNHHHSHRGHP
ncbi:hypothetical protein F8388_018098 [Cannabis sativa]|uniref:FRIGIDA-like protein n=1 Tax=Cannabis sativa TaxID=3483 RepID=A0A7J6HKQ3_CANSA|nr:hypothetical protein F8388_018098 [Cannabis sativa]